MIVQNIKLLLLIDFTKRERKAVLISSLWSMLEFYDFLVFGFMGIYFSQHLFHQFGLGDSAAFELFAIFILGYLVRPLGMGLYSKIAPHYSSRKVGSVISLLLLISTVSIGFLPEYNQFGISALMLITIARLVQGIAGGAEMQGEYDHLSIKLKQKVSFAVIGILLGNEVGQFLAISINRILNFYFDDRQMEVFGWRIPFFVGGALTLIVYLMRTFIGDKLDKKHCKRSIIPTYKLFSYYPDQTIIAIILSGLKGCMTFFFLIFIPYSMFYVLKYSIEEISQILFLATIFSMCISYLINQRSNFDNSAKSITYCIIALIPATLLWLGSFNHPTLLILSLLLFATLSGLLSFLVPRAISGLFPSAIRLSGVTYSHNTGFIVFGGLVPLVNLIFTHLISLIIPNCNPNKIFLISAIIYIAIISILSIISVAKLIKLANYKELNLIRQQLRQKMTQIRTND